MNSGRLREAKAKASSWARSNFAGANSTALLVSHIGQLRAKSSRFKLDSSLVTFPGVIILVPIKRRFEVFQVGG